MSQEDISTLCFLRMKIPRIRAIKIKLGDSKLSDEALFDVFSCLFWKNNLLQSLSFISDARGPFEKSILYLAENILPTTLCLKHLEIGFANSKFSPRAINSLTQSVSKIARNLQTFEFASSFNNVDTSALQKLFVRMPKLRTFGFYSTLQDISDDIFNRFISKTLPSLKKLKYFELNMNFTSVTDLSIRKFFESLPENWFVTLCSFKMDLSVTRITNESLQEFVYQTLPKFQRLRTLELLTDYTQVTPDIKNKISRWK